jgi:hypothetical protein
MRVLSDENLPCKLAGHWNGLRFFERGCYDFGDRRFQRLAEISVAHLYRLRASRIRE